MPFRFDQSISLRLLSPYFCLDCSCGLSFVEIEGYSSILDITGTGIMAYVEIPKLKTKLPIYHGTDEAVLEIAIGHIPGTSFPIGGKGTHAVISGHRGLPSAKLFSNLNQLKNDDTFMIHGFRKNADL